MPFHSSNSTDTLPFYALFCPFPFYEPFSVNFSPSLPDISLIRSYPFTFIPPCACPFSFPLLFSLILTLIPLLFFLPLQTTFPSLLLSISGIYKIISFEIQQWKLISNWTRTVEGTKQEEAGTFCAGRAVRGGHPRVIRLGSWRTFTTTAESGRRLQTRFRGSLPGSDSMGRSRARTSFTGFRTTRLARDRRRGSPTPQTLRCRLNMYCSPCKDLLCRTHKLTTMASGNQTSTIRTPFTTSSLTQVVILLPSLRLSFSLITLFHVWSPCSVHMFFLSFSFLPIRVCVCVHIYRYVYRPVFLLFIISNGFGWKGFSFFCFVLCGFFLQVILLEFPLRLVYLLLLVLKWETMHMDLLPWRTVLG